jgi:hypothetical protein
MQTESETRTMVPALEKYAQGPLSELWKRPGLSPRDRSVVAVAALIARNQTTEMPYYFNLALDNGVKPREISEITTHLAFYSGGRTPCPQRQSRKMSSPSVKSEPTRCLLLHLRSCRSTRQPKLNARQM